MDEDELRVLLLERASRGTRRGADALVEAVDLSLPQPRPARRRQRVVFAFAMLAAAVVASAMVFATRGADRGVHTGRGVPPAGHPSSVATTAPAIVSTSTAVGPSTAETIGSVHPINAEVAWVVTNRRVIVTDDRGAHWKTVVRLDVQAAAFSSPTDGVVAYFRNGYVRVAQIHDRVVDATSDLEPVDVRTASVHLTHAPDQYVLWVNDDCHGSAEPPCGTDIFHSPAGVEWSAQWSGRVRDGLRCVQHGSCWAFDYDESGSPVLMRSADSGATWSPVHDSLAVTAGRPVGAQIITALDNVFSYEVEDQRVGDDSPTPLFVVSVDSGKHFAMHEWPASVSPPAPDDPYLGIVRHANGTWTAMVRNTILQAKDDTLHWNVLETRLPFFVTASKWSDSRTAWIAGIDTPHHGTLQVATRLAYTLDAGAHWNVVALPSE